ncbi:TPM domain-containing protein [Microbacterium kribbense]|uniref:TPM domain-containing protein n=1 Tax=Microbacterium kribbense TaxID=433645 RepID=A0ABP7GR09_9MICO
MRLRKLAALVAVSAALILGASAAASATDPVTLGAGHVLDQSSALSQGQLDAADARLKSLYTQTGVDLYVVFVPTFTDPGDRQEWADRVAVDNGLGSSQYLMAIATDARQFTTSADSAGPLSNDQLDAIEAAVKPHLSDGDWSGAISVAADQIQSALGGGAGGSGGGPLTAILIVVVIIVVIVLVIVLIVRSRKKKNAGATSGPAIERLDTKELARRAGSALVQTDDALRTSGEELGFARAQFGDDATTEFTAALAQAKENLDAAFALQQKLNDSVADTEEQTRAWNTQIIQLCADANKGLDEKAAAFDELRKLEQNAPEALARIQQERAKAGDGMAPAATALQKLGIDYAPESLSTVTDNIDQATQRLAFADEQLNAAQTAMAAGNGGQAAVAIRAGEQAVDQALLLQRAIGKLGTDLAAAQEQIGPMIIDLESDLATASTVPDPDGRVAAVVTATRTQVDAAKADAAAGKKHPLATMKALEAVNTQIDQTLAGARDAATRAQRARQMLGQVMMQAQAQVSAAEDYVTSRRGAIGADARTRLAQAGAELVSAQQLQTSDPDQALARAQRADQLAGQAMQYAQNDVGGFGAPAGGGGGGGMLGAMIGGIVINSLLGGGSGMFGGGGGSGMFGGGSAGSFGGGGTRGRRGGGRF